MSSPVIGGSAVPSRLTTALLAWSLLSTVALMWAVGSTSADERSRVSQWTARELASSTSAHVRDTMRLAMTLGDDSITRDVADSLMANDPELQGIRIVFADQHAMVVGNLEGDLIQHRRNVSGDNPDGDILFAGDRLPGYAPVTTSLGSVEVFVRNKVPTIPFVSIKMRATLAVVVLGLLTISLWIRRRVRRLATVADALASGSLTDFERIKGSDEIAQASYALGQLRDLLAQDLERVQGRNTALLRDVTLKEDRLERIDSFASTLVAPYGTDNLLRQSLAALAVHTDTSLAMLFMPTADARSVVCEAVHGADPNLDDPRFAQGWDASHVSLESQLNLDLGQLGPSHPWMAAMRRNIPLHALAVPLRFQGRLEAVAVLARQQPWLQIDQQFVTDASRPFAIALANRHAYETVLAMKRQLQDRNDELLRQRDKLRVVDRMRAQFVANMSHELRTPINAIIGYTELVADGCYGPVTERQRAPLETALEASANLLKLVNEVLDLSRAEADGIDVDLKPTDVRRLADEVARIATALCKTLPYKPLVFGPSVVIATDPGRLQQILTNLVGNAIKFTSEGSVTTTVVPQTDGGVHIVIEDTGIGIEPSHMELIFEEFRQVDGSATRAYDGVGLGLAISRRLTGALGGELSVTSTPGQGSCFTLKFPARPVSNKPALKQAS